MLGALSCVASLILFYIWVIIPRDLFNGRPTDPCSPGQLLVTLLLLDRKIYGHYYEIKINQNLNR